MYLHFGADFVAGYLLAGNLFYFTQPAIFSSRGISHTFYARAFIGAFFPWSVVAVGRGLDALRRGTRAGGLDATLWIWVAVVVGFFSLARFKLDHYIFPAAPACCILAARAWAEATRDDEGRLRFTRASVLLVGAAMIVGGS